LNLSLFVRRIKGHAFRVVEDQEEIATLELVDDTNEQMLLEEILENSKPVSTFSRNVDYLISTPFRYAPLKYGSRFGGRFENSLFYGSLSKHTALCETAYYRFLFWTAMIIKPVSGLRTSHTVFQINYQTDHGLQLQDASFKKHHQKLTHPTNYSFTQQLGKEMREQAINGFEFTSARDIQNGLNIAFFTIDPIRSKYPLHKESFTCLTRDDTVMFKQNGTLLSYGFPITDFFYEGRFVVVK